MIVINNFRKNIVIKKLNLLIENRIKVKFR